jgi:hypothetical protein
MILIRNPKYVQILRQSLSFAVIPGQKPCSYLVHWLLNKAGNANPAGHAGQILGIFLRHTRLSKPAELSEKFTRQRLAS